MPARCGRSPTRRNVSSRRDCRAAPSKENGYGQKSRNAHALFASDPELSTKIRAIAQAGVDVVYDFVGKATFPVGVAAVRDGGVIAAIGAASGQPPAATEQMASRGIQIRAGGTPQHVHGGTVAVATEQLWDAVRADLFSDLEVVRYRFEQIGGAHADMESRRLAGLPVLIV